MAKIRQIDILKLTKGMYVVDTSHGGQLAPPMYSVEGFVLSSGDSRKFKQRGFLYVCIDVELSANVPEPDIEVDVSAVTLDPADVPAIQATTSYQEELHKARELHTQALEAAKSLYATFEAGLNQETVQSIQYVLEGTIESLKRNENAMLGMMRLKAADEYTFTHSVNVAMYAVVLGRRLHIKDAFLVDLALAGFFHDIGKVLVPPEILQYPGKLDAEKLKTMQAHAELGYQFLEHYPNVPAVARTGAMDHHERCDGSGYPLQKKHDAISLVGRILAVADVYDALTSKRCYKEAFSPARSLSIMYNNREQDFSAGFVEAFIEGLGVYPVGSLVRLSNSYLAVVMEQNQGLPLRPKVVTLVDAFGDKIDYPRMLDLAVHGSISISSSILSLPVNIDLEQAVLYAII